MSVAACAAIVSIAGCDDPAASDDEASVRRTVEGLYSAVARNDGKRACAALTIAARRETEAIDGTDRPCEVVLVELFGGGPTPRITGIEVGEDEATVTLAGGEGGNAKLVRKGDSWLLEAY